MKKKLIYLFIIISLLIIFRNNLIDLYNLIVTNFNKSIIQEKRYLILLKGLKSTLIISILSIIIGLLLGLFVSYFRTCRIKLMNILAKVFISFMQGMPITILLLISYYCIFANVIIDPIIVAIMTYSVYFSAYASEMYHSASLAINKTEISAAYSLGLNKFQVLRYIILPHAIDIMLPSLKNEVVTIIKLTSVVGYIAIIDLTRASDLIRNRTFDAYFILIFTAFIYYLICKFVSILLDLLHRYINPRKDVK